MEKAYFAAGCFWGVEHAFRQVPGVVDAVSGYMGGKTESPTYRDVCSGTTGHAEAVEVSYDPTQVSYDTLVQKFFSIHDPTTPNRQGPDVGTQYRSAIFYTTDEEREIVERVIEEIASQFSAPIVTELAHAPVFYPAEDYHQRYFEKNPGRAACHI
jgi:methionine-S-sulfoxide reductase